MAQLEEISESQQMRTYSYSCAMLQIDSKTRQAIRSYITENIDINDVYYGEEDCDDYGIELNSHITIVYGYMSDDIAEIADSFRAYSNPSVHFQLGNINYFAHKQYYVLYIEVLNNEEVINLRKCSVNSGLRIVDSYPVYTPHVTLAYILPDAMKNYRHLIGDNFFNGINCTGTQIKITTSDGKVGKFTL